MSVTFQVTGTDIWNLLLYLSIFRIIANCGLPFRSLEAYEIEIGFRLDLVILAQIIYFFSFIHFGFGVIENFCRVGMYTKFKKNNNPKF